MSLNRMRTRIKNSALLILLAWGADLQGAFVKLPYLQNLMDTSVVVRWETSSPQNGRVQYGLTTAYGQEAEHRNATTQHELRLSSLLQDTLYHYRAISRNDTSVDATFHTPVLGNKPFRFIAYGDTRSDSAAHQSVVDRMALVSPAPGFMIHVGDLTYAGADSEYQTFFNVEQGLLNRVTPFPSLGNHDLGDTTNWATFFALPGNERWYSIRYGNSSFHCLDNYSPDTVGTPQYGWLLSELLADSADPSVRHIFVYFHEPPYTTNAGHTSNLRIRQHLCPLMERFHVRIAFQGHIHAYEHSLANGVHYIISGGGGAPLHTTWDTLTQWTVYRETVYQFTLVDVRGDTVYSKGVKPSGAVIDSFRIVAPPSSVTERKPVALEPVLSLVASPNPFADRITIGFTLPRSGRAKVFLYNASGQRVAVLADGVLPAGEHQRAWKAKEAPSGIYFCVLKTPDAVRVIRLTRIR